MCFHDTRTGTSVVTVPPQLTTCAVLSWCFDAVASRLYVLLDQGHVHVWQVLAAQPAAVVDIWVHLAAEQLTCLGLLVSGGIPDERAQKLGLCAVGQSMPDLIMVGTSTGDVMFLSAEGQVQMRFCAHKLLPVKHVCACAQEHRLLTVTDAGIKLWDLSKGARMLFAAANVSQVTCVTTLGCRFALGTSGGGVRFIEMRWGSEQPVQGTQHGKRTTSVQADCVLGLLVSSSLDGTVKVWNTRGELCSTIWIAQPVTCACIVSGDGDIVCGIGQELVHIRSGMYSAESASNTGPTTAETTPLEVSRATDCPLARHGVDAWWPQVHTASSDGSAGSSSASDSDNEGQETRGRASRGRVPRASTDVQRLSVAALAQLRKEQMAARFQLAGEAVRMHLQLLCFCSFQLSVWRACALQLSASMYWLHRCCTHVSALVCLNCQAAHLLKGMDRVMNAAASVQLAEMVPVDPKDKAIARAYEARGRAAQPIATRPGEKLTTCCTSKVALICAWPAPTVCVSRLGGRHNDSLRHASQ